jgi:hypothetical protein
MSNLVIKMVKQGSDRSAKYDAKFDATVIATRYTATAAIAKAAQATMQQLLATKNGNVRAILNEAGIYPILTVQYQAFCNKLFGICNRLAGLTTTPVLSPSATLQANVAIATFKKYGADEDVLKSIWTLYVDMLGAAPSPVPTIS